MRKRTVGLVLFLSGVAFVAGLFAGSINMWHRMRALHLHQDFSASLGNARTFRELGSYDIDWLESKIFLLYTEVKRNAVANRDAAEYYLNARKSIRGYQDEFPKDLCYRNLTPNGEYIGEFDFREYDVRNTCVDVQNGASNQSFERTR